MSPDRIAHPFARLTDPRRRKVVYPLINIAIYAPGRLRHDG